MNSMKKIMVVEDEQIIALGYIMALKKAEFEVFGAFDTAQKAIEIVPSIKPDLILMDIKLKGTMDGIDAAEQILKNGKFPIIFMSGNNDLETKTRIQKIKQAIYLNKPVVINKMIKKINELLN